MVAAEAPNAGEVEALAVPKRRGTGAGLAAAAGVAPKAVLLPPAVCRRETCAPTPDTSELRLPSFSIPSVSKAPPIRPLRASVRLRAAFREPEGRQRGVQVERGALLQEAGAEARLDPCTGGRRASIR